MPDQPPSSLASARLQLGVALGCLLVAMWIAIGLHLNRVKAEEAAAWERDSANLTLAFAEQVTSTVRGIDLTLLHLRERWLRDRPGMDAAVAEYQGHLRRQMTLQLGVIDREGRLAYSSLDPHPKPVDLSDREHFRVHADGKGDRLFVSKPVLGRVSQKWSIQFTRPLDDGRNGFQGVMVLSIAPEYFSGFYDSFRLGEDGVVALVRDGGDYLARSPNPEAGLGKVLRDVPYLAPGASDSGRFRRIAQADGIERLYTWRRIPEYGLTVVVGKSVAAVMAPYAKERFTYLLGGGLFSLLLTLLFAGMVHALNQRSRAAANLEASELRYRTLVSALTEGVLLVDRQGVVMAANTAARRAFAPSGLEPVGLNLLAAGVAVTDADGTPLPSEQTPLATALAEGRTTVDTVIGLPALPGGPRWLRISASPFSGKANAGEAVVISFSDITADRQVQESQRLASAVIENAAEGVLVTDVEGIIEMVNPAFTAITGFAPEELIGQTPRVLRSGRHDAAFYREMWQTIRDAGRWQGEVWNRRKNGQIYPEWLTISVVHDGAGRPRHYIGVFSDISERKQREHRIWRQANFDALTDLPNRTHFNERLNQAVAEARRHGHPLALLFIDLDHFKWVNDTLGHEAGNQLLRQAARRMIGCLRSEDTLARLSGDEFAALLPTLGRSDDADIVGRKLLDVLSRPYQIDERDVVITASIGVALFPSEGEDGASLLKNADVAMYRAKEGGRNGLAYFTPALHARAEERLRLAAELRQAIAAKEFRLHFQPVTTTEGVLRGAEALLRWQHPQRGLVAPGEFIAIAEEIGLIPDITAWILPAALAQLQRWHDRHGYRGSVAVNLSSVEFRNRMHLEGLLALIEEAAPEAGSLTLEITESSLLSGDDTVRNFLDAARRLGARIALDDFGTGYSSLSYLSRFPFDIVKIDRQFVARLPDSEQDMALVEAILAMARRLHLKVVAEGVETEAQRDCLAGLGCELLQGYLFSPPLTEEAFAARFLAP